MQALVGATGIMLAWGLALSQLLKTFKSKEGISTTTWILYLAVNFSWLSYSLVFDNIYLLINMVGSAFLTSAIIIRSAPRPAKQILFSLVLTGTIVTLGEAISWTAATTLITFLAVFLRFPQIKELLVRTQARGVSTTTWILSAVNNGVWIAVSWVGGDIRFAVANLIMGASSVVVAVLAFQRNTVRSSPSTLL